MPNTITDSKHSLPNNLAAAELGQNKPSQWRLGERTKEVGHIVFRPFTSLYQWGKATLSPAPEPAESLAEIDRIARKGLEQAVNNKVPIDEKTGEFQVKIDRLLSEKANLPIPSKPSTVEKLPREHWIQQQEELTNLLCKHLSFLRIFSQMKEACGLKSDNSFELFSLVKRAIKDEKSLSVWKIFRDTHSLSFWEKIKVGWVYWFYYQTSLISNTIETYVKNFLGNAKEALTTDNSQTRSAFFRLSLENVKEFLIEDITAMKKFAREEGHGDRDTYREEAIDRHYGFSLERLCKMVSEKRVKPSLIVPMFRQLQKILILGLFFQCLEWLANRFIIQRSMKRSILPQFLVDAVEKGVSETASLDVAISFTRFLTSQLELLGNSLHEKEDSPKPTGQFPGAEALPETIKYLQKTLYLYSSSETSFELRQKIRESENWKWPWDKHIDASIERGIIDGVTSLFHYLNETAQTGELFASFLKQVLEPFSRTAPISHEALRAQYKTDLAALEKVADKVFDKIIRKAVTTQVNWNDPKVQKQTVEDAFAAKQTVASATCDELQKLCKQMEQKVQTAKTNPDSDVQTDIASFLQYMQVFANREETQDQLKKLEGVFNSDKDRIWRILTPLYQQAEEIGAKVLRLQKLQETYPTSAKTVKHLELLQDKLRSIREQSSSGLPNLLSDLSTNSEKLASLFGAKTDNSKTIQSFGDKITESHENVVKEQKVLDVIYALSPPRSPGQQEREQEGLIDQLLNYHRDLLPRGSFKLEIWRAKVKEQLALLPKEEREELISILDNGDYRILAKVPKLSASLQRIYDAHMGRKNKAVSALNESLEEASLWTKDKLENTYRPDKTKNYEEMESEMSAISTAVEKLRTDVSQAHLELPPPFTSLGTNLGSSLWSIAGTVALPLIGNYVGPGLGAGIGGAIGGLTAGPLGVAAGATIGATVVAAAGNPVAAATIGAAGGAVLGKWFYAKPEDPHDFTEDRGTMNKTATAAAAAATGLAYFLPESYVVGKMASMAVGSYVVGSNAKEATQTATQRNIYPKIKELFHNAYWYIVPPRHNSKNLLYQAAMTRFYKVLAEEK